jgi:hypothetical protein
MPTPGVSILSHQEVIMTHKILMNFGMMMNWDQLTELFNDVPIPYTLCDTCKFSVGFVGRNQLDQDQFLVP